MNYSIVAASSQQISNIDEDDEERPVTKNRISSREEADLEYARGTYIDLIEKNRASIEIMMELARDSEHPRVFEVLSNSIKTTSDITDRLISLHLSNKELRQSGSEQQKSGNSTPVSTTNNNVFIGSTEELQKLLQGKPLTKDEKVISPS